MLKNLIILSICYVSCISADTEKRYGSFNLTISRFEVCKGPKHKDCANATAVISGYNTLLYDLHVFQNVSPAKAKIAAVSNGKQFLRLQMKRTCDHLFLKPLFQMLLNVTRDCVVLKGHYQFTIDILKIAQTYYDGAFFFGNWTFKSIFFNDECNFSCSVIKVQLSPKDKNLQN